MYNDKVRKKFKEQYSKMKEVAARLEVKILINLSVALDHTILVVVEAPSIQAVENFVMEIGAVSFNTLTVRHAQYSEDFMKRFF
ncbi:MAG: hypothetical protein FJ150_05995 [Euryarchaeota archaeon]|nr:hypothetical protein [Euryarchaeota archaeon]